MQHITASLPASTVPRRRQALLALLATLALSIIALALGKLHAAGAGVNVADVAVGGTPVRVYRAAAADGGAAAGAGPVVLIAHGFAGSKQLMQSFALTLARNGYIAVTFDFPGHGRNPRPLTGSITEVDGATRTLLDETTKIATYARSLGDGRLAVLGHSMASDIVIRFAQATPNVAATIAVSMFSATATASTPHNLLVIVGDWEGRLKREALRVVGLATSPLIAQPGVTYGDATRGNGRRAAFSARSDHLSVLFSRQSMAEALAWLDQAFARRSRIAVLDSRGPWIILLFVGIALLAKPMSALLPRLAAPPLGGGGPWRRAWLSRVLPMLVTPLLLRVLPTHFLPVLVGDYLAVHFAAYGLLTWLVLRWQRPQAVAARRARRSFRFWGAVAAVAAFSVIGVFWPIDVYFTSFIPGQERLPLIFVTFLGTLLFFSSDEWSTRGEHAPRGAYAVSKMCFLISLGIAVALDLKRLFFIIIIVPIIVLFFCIYGLFSSWVYRRTGDPAVAGIVNAAAFAWAIGTTFPLLAG